MKIPLCKVDIGEEELNEIKIVLESGWFVHGPQTKKFESDFAKYLGVKKAFTFNSCTSALQTAIRALGLKGEIILPSFTFVASANAIVNEGCKPVFCEIRKDTCNIDEYKIEEKITKNTVAIMPVHYAGQSCNMEKIMSIAKKHNLKVIEDSAECLGGEYKGKKTGSIGDIGCFSFYPTKNITTGEGGMLTTNDESIAEKVCAIRGHGISTSASEREKKEKPWLRAAFLPGYNFRLGDIQSAIGNVQLKKVDKMNQMRKNNAAYLNESLKGIKQIILPSEDKNCKHVYQMYTIKTKGFSRNKLILGLREKEIEASVHFEPPVHLQPYYMDMGCKKGDFPITEDISESIITLPMFPSMTKEQMDYIVSSIKEIIAKNSQHG